MKLETPNPALTFISPADIMRVLTHITSYSGARNRLLRIKAGLGKKKHQGLSVKEFAEWEGLDSGAVMVTLHPARTVSFS
jgi:hypothetical protein